MTDLPMFNYFLILYTQEESHKKKAKADKNVEQWKSFLMKSRCIVLN